jgi:hypothetical protein
MGLKMISVKQQRLNNIAMTIIVMLMLVMIVLQAWHMVDSTRPVIRPRIVPNTAPKLPDAFLQKFRNHDGMRLDTEQVFYLVV